MRKENFSTYGTTFVYVKMYHWWDSKTGWGQLLSLEEDFPFLRTKNAEVTGVCGTAGQIAIFNYTYLSLCYFLGVFSDIFLSPSYSIKLHPSYDLAQVTPLRELKKTTCTYPSIPFEFASFAPTKRKLGAIASNSSKNCVNNLTDRRGNIWIRYVFYFVMNESKSMQN